MSDEKYRVLQTKAKQAQIIFDDLTKQFNIQPLDTYFIADPTRVALFESTFKKDYPFPFPLKSAIEEKRVPGINLLFKDEKIVQTPAIAAVLAACSSVVTKIGELRGDNVDGAKTYCDIAFSGLQAIRLFMAKHKGVSQTVNRMASGVRVNNALNGSYFKYIAKDGRQVSFHVYYQSQQKKLVEALPFSKPYNKYNMISLKADRQEVKDIVSKHAAQELEEISFNCGASGCMIRSREEWENSEVGKAVCAMPLIREEKMYDSGKKVYSKVTSRGPLSGIKVLDLTHIIAGPACSRILAEYGADVLLVRRGKFNKQEQSMLEFDGWAGKHAIHLDFNHEEDLVRVKELIKQADVVTYSYQNGTLDKFGLSEKEIRELNPNIIYANLMCFSDSVWKERPGWAPLAEDITGLSVRNGSLEKPVNLNGVPLDYFPGFILALGTLLAIQKQLQEGGGYKVTTSLTRGAQYLHECSDLVDKELKEVTSSKVIKEADVDYFNKMLIKVPNCADCTGFFPTGATYNTQYPLNEENLIFTDENTGFRQ